MKQKTQLFITKKLPQEGFYLALSKTAVRGITFEGGTSLHKISRGWSVLRAERSDEI